MPTDKSRPTDVDTTLICIYVFFCVWTILTFELKQHIICIYVLVNA